MAEIRLTKLEKGETKIRSVPIAVTPEGFWCCPTPAGFQKTLKAQTPLNKPKSPSPPHKRTSVHKKQTPWDEKKPTSSPPKPANPDDQKSSSVDIPNPIAAAAATAERIPRANTENLPRKVSIEFGELGTSDMKVVLFGNHGFLVKLNVHRNILVENSSFFAERLSEKDSGVPSLELNDCDDVEIYVETVGLMYCKDMRQRLIKQSVQRVLRILQVAEVIGFSACIQSCLDYLEAVPWVGEEEEEKVVSSLVGLQGDVSISPVLKRVSSDATKHPNDTLSHIIELVLKSSEERGRREMKSTVLKLLRENSSSSDLYYETIYTSCRGCLNSLLSHFRLAAESKSCKQPIDIKEPVSKQIALEADNLLWLLQILAERQAADEFALMWANQQELASLHTKLPTMTRYHISNITARLCVGIGRRAATVERHPSLIAANVVAAIVQ
ncbi:hypothetical protein Nepgr_008299 [Nepenthes gracilis]|uniref:At3g05675-like ankyrin-like domain-containing protein n=1 Tax=Nepenthes gracilis TaxID=150966 RepID=A0AAD3S8V3_NEPGR|nr:hypothetical protein Nepgr_008299 [Nepenthes gracilis]